MTRAADKRARQPCQHRVPAPEEPPRPRVYLQGFMTPTPGDRDASCERYADCLLAHVRAHPHDAHASCPKDCRWRASTRLRATDFATPADGAADAMDRARVF